jgi:hypothetical protein
MATMDTTKVSESKLAKPAWFDWQSRTTSIKRVPELWAARPLSLCIYRALSTPYPISVPSASRCLRVSHGNTALVGFGDNNEFAVDVYIKPAEAPLAEIELTASLLVEIE